MYWHYVTPLLPHEAKPHHLHRQYLDDNNNHLISSSNRSSPPVRSNYLTSVSSSCPSKQELCCRLTRPVPYTVSVYIYIWTTPPPHTLTFAFSSFILSTRVFFFLSFLKMTFLYIPPPSLLSLTYLLMLLIMAFCFGQRRKNNCLFKFSSFYIVCCLFYLPSMECLQQQVLLLRVGFKQSLIIIVMRSLG